MTARTFVTRLDLFPIKSLDSCSVDDCIVGPSGSLLCDRLWRIVRRDNREVVNGKAEPLLMSLRCTFNLSRSNIALAVTSPRSGSFTCDLPTQVDALAGFLSSHLNYDVDLEMNSAGGYPDDPEAAGPTIISTATLREVARWVDLEVHEVRRRLRTNIEIDGDGIPPFWEDNLFGEPGGVVPFRIGNVAYLGSNPCARCAVPARDSMTGRDSKGFQKIVAQQRKAMLPSWAATGRFNHFYRLAVNTHIPATEWGKSVHVGDLFSLS